MSNISDTETLDLTARGHWTSASSSLLGSFVRTAISKRRIVIPAVDAMILTAAITTILVLFEGSFVTLSIYHKVLYLLFSVGITLTSFYMFGLYDNIRSIKPADLAYRFMKVFVVASTMNMFVCLLFGMDDYIGYTTLLFAILGWCVCARHLFIQMVIPQPPAKRLMIICNSGESYRMAESLAYCDESLYEMAGCVVGESDLSEGCVKPPQITSSIPVHESVDLVESARDINADIIAISDDLPEKSALEINECLSDGLEVAHLNDIYEKTLGKLPMSQATFIPSYKKVNRPLYVIAKRTLDFMIALVGCLCLLVIFVPVSIAIITTSPGPLFYTQKRCGKNGRIFKLYKFRTMIKDAEMKGPRLAAANDPRITVAGRYLRRMHIDEMPQFFNLLRGDLSLVGPRPERPEIINSFKNEIPFFEYRHLIKPGITGWAQVKAPYASTLEDLREKLQYDFFYIKNRCFFLDLVVFIKTAKSVVQMRGL